MLRSIEIISIRQIIKMLIIHDEHDDQHLLSGYWGVWYSKNFTCLNWLGNFRDSGYRAHALIWICLLDLCLHPDALWARSRADPCLSTLRPAHTHTGGILGYQPAALFPIC